MAVSSFTPHPFLYNFIIHRDSFTSLLTQVDDRLKHNALITFEELLLLIKAYSAYSEDINLLNMIAQLD